MKCRYKYCKHGGEVDKSIAIKEGTAYYHKECLYEKNMKNKIEEYWFNNFPNVTISILRKVMNQLINDNKIDVDYIMFTMKYIRKFNKPINSPFGLLNYCNDNNIKQSYKKEIINKKYNDMKDKIDSVEISSEEVKYTYKPKNIKKITDLI